MTRRDDDLALRWSLAREVAATSPEPLHVPLGLAFHPLRGEHHLASWQAHVHASEAGTTFAPATLYVHVPFCARVCTFCMLSASRLPKPDVVARYVDALVAQIERYRAVAERLHFRSLHIGGGTPTLLSPSDLDRLLAALARFPRAEGFRIGVEAHPGSTTEARLDVLARHGVDRVSFGVESLTESVLRAVDRTDQSLDDVRGATRLARARGLAVNFDLLAGLPGETLETFLQTIDDALALEPDSVSVNRFLGEGSELGRHGFAPSAVERARVDAMLVAADARIRAVAPPRWPEQPLTRAGFGTQYVWERDPTARRYFQDDMVGPVSTLAFGHGALGHLYGEHFAIPRGALDGYVESLLRGELPEMVAAPSPVAFERAFHLADRIVRGHALGEHAERELYRSIFGHPLTQAYGRELAFLRADAGATPPTFVELAAFFRWDAAALAEQRDALRSHARPVHESSSAAHVVRDATDLAPLAAGTASQVDVGAGVEAELATSLRRLARKRPLAILGEAGRELRQYDAHAHELTASMLWTRLSVRANQASRGEERWAIPPARRS